jgi:hypothetical protein
VERTLRARLPAVRAMEFALLRAGRPDAAHSEEGSALLRVTARDPDPRRVGRAFSAAVVEMALASYPGFQATAPPGDETPFPVFWPTLVPAELVEQVVVMDDGERIGNRAIGQAGDRAAGSGQSGTEEPPVNANVNVAVNVRSTSTRRVALGSAFGARSGDKGGNANVGVWALSDAGYAWLEAELTAARFQQLVPETASLPVRRHAFANLRAVNFVIVGLLGDGALSSTRLDPQAKGLGEFLRSRLVELPEEVLSARD